jgi:exonuclease III
LLISAYHPCHTEDEHSQFLDRMDTLLQKLPPSKIVIGADINADIGISSERDDTYAPTLGPHGLKKQNSKGRNLLALYMSHDLRVMNMYYTAKRDIGHGTWTNIPQTHNEPGAPSMLNVIVCSSSLHKRIQNCTVVGDGLESDHRAVSIDVVITSIKFKDNPSARTGSTDWQKS